MKDLMKSILNPFGKLKLLSVFFFFFLMPFFVVDEAIISWLKVP